MTALHSLGLVLKRDLSGQAIIWVAVMLPFFLAVAGLTLDAGLVFNERRDLQNVADAAARSGAMQIDQQVYRQTSGTSIVLNPADARQNAATYLASLNHPVRATVAADTGQVLVEVHRTVPTSFVRLVGLNTVDIAATATASVRYGIEQANG